MKEPLVPIFYQDCTPNASPYPEPEVTMWGTVPMWGQPPPAVRPERTRLPLPKLSATQPPHPSSKGHAPPLRPPRETALVPSPETGYA
jgi:hypothetical protein